MGRNSKYKTHVEPHLDEIPTWYEALTEGQIAKKLGISTASFENYKNQYPELVEALRKGKTILADELKDSLRRKAKGFYYTETKRTYVEDEDGQRVGEAKVEMTEKYAAPDTGAIHLLLKNIDPNWKNDDQATLALKREKLELEKQKAEAANW